MKKNSLKNEEMPDDIAYKFLLSSGMNLEYYDQVIFSLAYLEKAAKTNSLEFWYSGITITLSNGIKRNVLFIWEKYYDLPSAELKMNEVLMKLSEETLKEMSKGSLKQTLKRLRKTNINLN